MASSIIMQQTRGTASDIADLTPVDGQIVWDKTNNQIKIGNGTSKASALKATPEIVNALNSTNANAVLSAAQGKALADRVTTLENKPAGSTVSLINNHTTTTSGTGALDAYQGKVIYDAAVKAATTSSAGQVQLSDSTSGTSIAKAATENAVKKAYDRASTAISNASTAQSKADSAYTLANSAYNKAVSSSSSSSHPQHMSWNYGTKSSSEWVYPFGGSSGNGTWLYFKALYTDYFTPTGKKGLDMSSNIASGGDGEWLAQGEFIISWRIL